MKEQNMEELLSRLLDGGDLSESECGDLAAAIQDDSGLRATCSWFSQEALLSRQLSPDRAGELDASKERLLAKALLNEKRQSMLGSPAPSRWLKVLSGAAALLLVGLGAWTLLRPGATYPSPTVSGTYRVVRDGIPVVADSPRRGDRIITEKGKARLLLGGFCDLGLEPETEVVVRGGRGNESLELVQGAVVSRIEPGKGNFQIQTARGTIEVRGTEFFTSVEYPGYSKGEGTMDRTRSAMVKVVVIAGLVAYQFGDQTDLLTGGMSRLYAEEATDAIPEGLHGFLGVFQGRLVEKGPETFVLRVEKVLKAWKNNKAENPESAIGRNLQLVVNKHQRERYARVEVGDAIVVGGRHQGDAKNLNAVEVLVKAEEFPALEKKWAEAAQKREQREAAARKEREEKRAKEARADETGERKENREGDERVKRGKLTGDFVSYAEGRMRMKIEGEIVTLRVGKRFQKTASRIKEGRRLFISWVTEGGGEKWVTGIED